MQFPLISAVLLKVAKL